MLTAGQYLASRWWGPDQPACPAEAVDDATPWQSLHSSVGSISQIFPFFTLRGRCVSTCKGGGFLQAHLFGLGVEGRNGKWGNGARASSGASRCGGKRVDPGIPSSVPPDLESWLHRGV